jgi:acyl-CoA reductase-like NAD-dependent aldehyde dehydrogenase
VDINTVAPTLSGLAFLNSGQICVAVKRIFVHESIYDQFKAVFVAAVESFKTGNGADEGVFLGPIQNKQQYERVKTFLTDVRDKDQTIATGGNLIGTGTNGYFIQPTVIDAPADDSKIVAEEPFGPIVPLLKWSTEDEVIQRANNTDMGLGASVWSANVDNAVKIAEQIEAGSVWINEHLGISPLAAFTGHKHSGVGSEWGKPGLLAYTIPQTIYINRPKASL